MDKLTKTNKGLALNLSNDVLFRAFDEMVKTVKEYLRAKSSAINSLNGNLNRLKVRRDSLWSHLPTDAYLSKTITPLRTLNEFMDQFVRGYEDGDVIIDDQNMFANYCGCDNYRVTVLNAPLGRMLVVTINLINEFYGKYNFAAESFDRKVTFDVFSDLKKIDVLVKTMIDQLPLHYEVAAPYCHEAGKFLDCYLSVVSDFLHASRELVNDYDSFTENWNPLNMTVGALTEAMHSVTSLAALVILLMDSLWRVMSKDVHDDDVLSCTDIREWNGKFCKKTDPDILYVSETQVIIWRLFNSPGFEISYTREDDADEDYRSKLDVIVEAIYECFLS